MHLSEQQTSPCSVLVAKRALSIPAIERRSRKPHLFAWVSLRNGNRSVPKATSAGLFTAAFLHCDEFPA